MHICVCVCVSASPVSQHCYLIIMHGVSLTLAALEKEFDTVLVHSSAGVRVENPPGGVTMVLFVVQVQD